MESGFFSLVSRERMEDVLESIHGYTQLALQLMDGDGQVLMGFGKAVYRQPLCEPSDAAKATIAAAMKNAGII